MNPTRVLAAAAWLLPMHALLAQNLTNNPLSFASAPKDAHSRLWQSTFSHTNKDGIVSCKTNSFTEIATGMNYLVGGQWVASSAQIQITQTGAAAINTQHPTYLSANINTTGAVDLNTPDAQHLRSHIMGLAYFDAASSNSVLFAELQDSTGQVLPSLTQAIYTNAFSGCEADVLYLSTVAGLEQDIVLRAQLPSPSLWSLDPRTTWLQVWTEFTEAPSPQIHTSTNATTGWVDDDLEFGTMHMGRGKAFELSGQQPATRIYKHWRVVDNRTFLIEELPLSAIAAQLQNLPGNASNGTNSGGGASLRVPCAVRMTANPKTFLLPPPTKISPMATNPMRFAIAPPAPKGYVLDYHVMDSTQTNFTFQSDTTYYVSGSVYLFGPTTFEGGTVIKYTNSPSATLVVTNAIWKTASYHPAIFTASTDNSVGTSLSTSSLSGYYGNIALDMSTVANSVISNVRFLYLSNALSASSVTLRDAQIISCKTVFADDNNDFYLCNVLAANIGTFCNNIATGTSEHESYGHTFRAVNVTLDTCATLMADNSSSVFLTNCIFTSVTNWGAYISNYVDTTISSSSFQTVGNAAYYFADGSGDRGSGTTSIDPTTLADIQQKTTWPPVVYAGASITTNLTLSPQPIRDTNGASVDRGYHYDPIDYAFGSTTLSNATMTVSAGTVIAGFDDASAGYALTVGPDAHFVCQGTPLAMNHLVNFDTVQEPSASNWTTPGTCLLSPNTTDAMPFGIYCRFTDFSSLEQNVVYAASGSYSTMNVNFKDCQFHGGTIDLEYGAGFTNNLFERVFCIVQGYGTNALQLQNNLFWNGLYYHTSAGSNDLVENNMFYQTALYDFAGTNFTFGWNGYYTTNVYSLQATNSHDQFLTNDPNFQTGPLGNYYLPIGCPLIDHGSDLANNLGFYHYTTRTNELKETNSTVDVGYHYIALNAGGTPVDTDIDGIADYVEDSTGDGIYDSGDLSNWLHNPNWYVSQNGAGSYSGVDATDAKTLAWLNDSGNWGTNSNAINAGDTIFLVGTLTNTLNVSESGTQGKPITIYFTTGAKFSASTLTSGLCWIDMNYMSWIVVDGGINGRLELTDNGTPVSLGGTHTYNNNNIAGLFASTAHNITIQNLAIVNIYDRQTNSDTTPQGLGLGIYFSGSDLVVSNCLISGAQDSIVCPYGNPAVSNLFFWGNTLSNFNHGITVGAGEIVNPICLNVTIVSNYFFSGDAFETPDFKYEDTNGVTHYIFAMLLNNLGGWVTNGIYAANPTNIVSYTMYGNTTNFICLASNTNIPPPGNPGYWAALSGMDLGYHRDPIFLFNASGDTGFNGGEYTGYFSNVWVARNYIKEGYNPHSVTAGTSAIFLAYPNPWNMYHLRIYNNVSTVVYPLNWSGGSGFFGVTGTDCLLANNTGVGWNTNGAWGGGAPGMVAGGSNVFAYNNLVDGGGNGGVWITTVAASATASNSLNTVFCDYNVYNHFINLADFVIIVFQYNTAASPYVEWLVDDWNNMKSAWSAMGLANNFEPHGSTNLALIDGSFSPQSGDTVLTGQGTNLTALGIPGLNLDFNGNARSTNASWTIGAFAAP